MSQKLLIKKADGSVKEVERFTSIQRLIFDSLEIVQKGLDRINNRANSGIFNKEDAAMLGILVKSIKDLAQESREQEKASELKQLSDEEIVLLASKLLAQRETKTKEKTDGNTDSE